MAGRTVTCVSLGGFRISRTRALGTVRLWLPPGIRPIPDTSSPATSEGAEIGRHLTLVVTRAGRRPDEEQAHFREVEVANRLGCVAASPAAFAPV